MCIWGRKRNRTFVRFQDLKKALLPTHRLRAPSLFAPPPIRLEILLDDFPLLSPPLVFLPKRLRISPRRQRCYYCLAICGVHNAARDEAGHIVVARRRGSDSAG